MGKQFKAKCIRGFDTFKDNGDPFTVNEGEIVTLEAVPDPIAPDFDVTKITKENGESDIMLDFVMVQVCFGPIR